MLVLGVVMMALRHAEDISIFAGLLTISSFSVSFFVKMVHNGIEYGDMQLISEVYDILKVSFRSSSVCRWLYSTRTVFK